MAGLGVASNPVAGILVSTRGLLTYPNGQLPREMGRQSRRKGYLPRGAHNNIANRNILDLQFSNGRAGLRLSRWMLGDADEPVSAMGDLKEACKT